MRSFTGRGFAGGTPDFAGFAKQAGRNASVTIVSNWVAAFPEDEKKRLMKENPEIAETWDETYGDRMNQIVFIGRQISEEKITERLRQCH